MFSCPVLRYDKTTDLYCRETGIEYFCVVFEWESRGIKLMKKEKLIDILKKILQTDVDLDFLSCLTDDELQTLVACIRSRVDQG